MRKKTHDKLWLDWPMPRQPSVDIVECGKLPAVLGWAQMIYKRQSINVDTDAI